MGSGIFFPIGALPVILIILFTFNIKDHINSKETNLFNILCITNFVGLILEILCAYACKIYYSHTLLSLFILKSYLVYLIVWTALFSIYIFTISNEYNNKVIKYIHAFVVLFIIIAIYILPITPVIDESLQIHYTKGIGVNFSYGIGLIYIIAILIVLIKNLKKLRNKKYLPVFLFFIIGTIAISIQKNYPQFLLLTYSETIICLSMYFTIENPDMKMLAEVSAARDQADKANRAKSDFLSSMSHEIRTPLNAIVGLSEDIASYIDQVPPEVVEDTKDIQNASQTLLEIVGNILDISKIESNKMEIVNGPYNLKEEIEGLCKVTSTRIGDKPIDYTLTIADDVPYELIGDKGKVKEIVNNLFTNSIKYTEKGQINLSIRCVNDFANMYSTIYITCQDTGRGIKAESISRLFEKFDRLDVERNTTTEGTGLGLAITKKVIEMMGGKINVSSQFGVGSIFMVAIPQKISKIARPEGENELSETSQLANSNFDLGKRRVLIVDDNNLNIKVAIKALKDFNFDLDSCHSGQECLDKVAAGEHYDLILMDIMMPGMSGDTTLHKLQETGNFSIPVIALTADAIAGAKEKYISAGFVDYIAKPFSRDQIKGKLEKIFIKGNNQ